MELNLPAPKASLSFEFFAPTMIELVSVVGFGFGPELSYNSTDCSDQLPLFKTKLAQLPLATHCTGNK